MYNNELTDLSVPTTHTYTWEQMEIIMTRSLLFGRRPVTLLGFSLGARVVYFCLKVLLLASSRSFNILFPYTQVEREKKNQ
jgi:hypothetical protein